MDHLESDLPPDESRLIDDNPTPVIQTSKNKRDVIAFFFLGLCNNFCYGIMLSAAFDILSEKPLPSTVSPTSPPTTWASTISSSNLTTSGSLNYKDCNKVSTGAILLADVFPSLIAQSTAPLYFEYVSYNPMVVLSIGLAAASLLIVSFSKMLPISLLGVVCASAGSGLGEFFFLSLSSYFDKSVMIGYSSGTGASGVLFSLSYVLLTSVLGFSPRESILIVLVVPAIHFIVYFFLLTKRPSKKSSQSKKRLNDSSADKSVNQTQSHLPGVEQNKTLGDNTVSPQSVLPEYGRNGSLLDNSVISSQSNLLDDGLNEPEVDFSINSPQSKQPECGSSEPVVEKITKSCRLTSKEKRRAVKPLLFKYMIPLATVYLAEYLVNQGLFELLYFPALSWLNHDDQYRWYQLVYQVGVFISRSSIALFSIKQLWLFPVLQCSVFGFLLTVAMYHYVPSIWIVFATIAIEGLIAGLSFANTFYQILIEVKEEYREFAMGLSSISITFGTTFSGLISIPLHNALCKS
ncbi:battenin-like [Anneissia japonica]|uniref:battenin-like n=1 Tax=Anneissia japonica TaxID=1529436 RepID=UPI00142588F0|nr:battenin-like [Anneissia japonica]